MCECIVHTPIAELRFPKFPYNRRMLADYQAEIVELADFAWEPNGARRADGQRQYLSPHGGAVTNPTKVARSRGAGAGAGGCGCVAKLTQRCRRRRGHCSGHGHDPPSAA